MHLRNGEHGYGAVTKSLHWLTVLLFAAQFVVGYTMDADRQRVECDPAGERRSGGDTTDAEEELLDRLEDQCEAREEARDDRPSALHVALGASILVLGAVRLAWRRIGSLPPWDPRLPESRRRLVTLTERSLLALMFVVPGSGLLLLASDDLLAVHVAAHIAFFIVLAVHVTVVSRFGLIGRMLPGVSRSRTRR